MSEQSAPSSRLFFGERRTRTVAVVQDEDLDYTVTYYSEEASVDEQHRARVAHYKRADHNKLLSDVAEWLSFRKPPVEAMALRRVMTGKVHYWIDHKIKKIGEKLEIGGMETEVLVVGSHQDIPIAIVQFPYDQRIVGYRPQMLSIAMRPVESLTTKQVAQRLMITPQAVRNLLLSGRLLGRKEGRDWFIDASFLNYYVQCPRGRPKRR